MKRFNNKTPKISSVLTLVLESDTLSSRLRREAEAMVGKSDEVLIDFLVYLGKQQVDEISPFYVELLKEKFILAYRDVEKYVEREELLAVEG